MGGANSQSSQLDEEKSRRQLERKFVFKQNSISSDITLCQTVGLQSATRLILTLLLNTTVLCSLKNSAISFPREL